MVFSSFYTICSIEAANYPENTRILAYFTHYRCKQLRKTLIAAGPTGLRDDQAAQEHLVECSEFYAFLESLADSSLVFEGFDAARGN